MTDVIELRELRVAAIVGVLPEERLRAQPLAFDIDIERPFARAAADDDLSETTNYADVLTVVALVATTEACLLLESLAYRVANQILERDGAITSVTVAVRKLEPPVPEDVASVGVRCRVQRP